MEEFGQFNVDLHTICAALTDEALHGRPFGQEALRGALCFVVDYAKPTLDMNIFYVFIEAVLPRLTREQIRETVASRNNRKAGTLASSISEDDNAMLVDVLNPH